jgi:hypothetical protein
MAATEISSSMIVSHDTEVRPAVNDFALAFWIDSSLLTSGCGDNRDFGMVLHSLPSTRWRCNPESGGAYAHQTCVSP